MVIKEKWSSVKELVNLWRNSKDNIAIYHQALRATKEADSLRVENAKLKETLKKWQVTYVDLEVKNKELKQSIIQWKAMHEGAMQYIEYLKEPVTPTIEQVDSHQLKQ